MVEHVAHAPEGPGSSLGSAGAGRAGEIVCLPSLVCLKDILGIGQVPLGQPEVIFWSIALEADQEFWSLVWADQSVGKDIFNLELLFSLYQLRGRGLMRWSHLWWAGVVGLQILHVLEWSESSKAWWDLHSHSVGSSEFQHFEGS